MPTERRVKLTVHVSRYFLGSTDGIRVRIEASNANLMPSKIFAYLLMPVGPQAESRAGMFDHICSPSDLEEYPEDEPVTSARPAWFRLDYVDVLLRSREEVHDFIADVKQDVEALKRTLDVMDSVYPAETYWIGTPPE